MRIQKIISSIWKQSIEEFLIYRATSLITFILAVVFLLIELFVGDIYFQIQKMLIGHEINILF